MLIGSWKKNMKVNKLLKVVVFGPVEVEEKIRKTIEKAAAGKVGNYSGWTFCSYGVVRVKALAGARPALGKVGEAVETKEFRMETVCFESELVDLVKRIKSVHPYEVVPIDVFEIKEAF